MLDYNFLKGETGTYLKKKIGIQDFSNSDLLFKPVYGSFTETLSSDSIIKTGFVYLTKVEEYYLRGYRYLPTYDVKKYKAKKESDPFPKKHYSDCEIITQYTGFVFSNAEKSVITDREPPFEKYPERKLNVCKNCNRALKKKLYIDVFNISYDEYVLKLEENDETKVMQTRPDGYVLNWEEISSCYRNSKNWTCESCHVKVQKEDYKWLHVHHIERTEKWNNKRSNLKCLCVECHSHVDEHHKKNFSTSEWQTEIMYFRDKYRK
jgi:hypothetical protein